jgi:hypothetical protein
MLRLAEEFQAAYGRPALDDLILRSVPDDDYEPGPLHRLLLKLPWADVFTTNYDRLLERAAANLPYRRYHVVTCAPEISSAMRPRIVKLQEMVEEPLAQVRLAMVEAGMGAVGSVIVPQLPAAP